MISTNVGRGNLNGFNLHLPGDVKLRFSNAKTASDMRQSLCKGARSVIRQITMYRSKIRPISEISKMFLRDQGMYQEAAEFGEAVEVVEAEEVALEAGEVMEWSAEALELLEAAEVIVDAEIVIGVVAAAAGSAAAGPLIGVGLVIALLLGNNQVSGDKRKLLGEEFRKLFQSLAKANKH